MKIVCISAILAVFIGTSAQAGCFGSANMYSCSDNQGNRYNVNRFGDMTTMNGSNSYNGSTWNQHSNTIGDTTYTNGRASNGQSWNATTTTNSLGTTTYGTDANGNSFRRTCGQFGCY